MDFSQHKSLPVSLAAGHRGIKKSWFQIWTLKITRAFGLDAAQGSQKTRASRMNKHGKKTWFQNWMLGAISYRGTEQAVGMLRSASTTDKNRAPASEALTVRRALLAGRLMRSEGRGGFTIVELTIATAVFSTVLLVGLASFLGIGKIFYKGVTLTQTQSAAQAVLDQLSNDLQFATAVVPAQATGTSAQFLCIGNVRYTYNLFKEVNLDAHDNASRFGLLRDVLPGNSGCANPFGPSAVTLSKTTELLGNKMRLSKLSVTPAKSSGGSDIQDLWNINLTLAYGDDNSLKNGDTANPVCDANLNSSQFCTVVNLSTSLNRGL